MFLIASSHCCQLINPQTLPGGGGKFTPKVSFIAVTPQRVGISPRFLVTFPEYHGATESRSQIHPNFTHFSTWRLWNRKYKNFSTLQSTAVDISASRWDTNEIPTATPMFSGTDSSLALRTLLRDVTGSRDFNMAASKPEVLVSPLLDKIESKFQLLGQGFWGRPS